MLEQSFKAMSTANSVFGRVRMGYAVIESQRLAGWRTLLADGMGMQVETVGGSLRVRIDERACRFLVQEGKAEDLTALGLELADESTHALVLQRLKAKGIAVELHTGEEAARRGVERFWRFRGPKNLAIELFYEPVLANTAPKLLTKGFVTGDMGFGHMAFVTRQPERTQAFWESIFDMRYSDEVHQSIGGVPLDFTFLRFNRRHHSVALASTPKIRLNPMRQQIQHMEVQAASLDDVGDAYRRCRALGFTIDMTVGRHANDKAVSFYARTPSGFDFEFGWSPVAVDEDTWKPEVWDRNSDWGHFPEGVTLLDHVGRLSRGVASLTQDEYVPGV